MGWDGKDRAVEDDSGGFGLSSWELAKSRAALQLITTNGNEVGPEILGVKSQDFGTFLSVYFEIPKNHGKCSIECSRNQAQESSRDGGHFSVTVTQRGRVQCLKT